MTDVLGELEIEAMIQSLDAACGVKTRSLSLKLPPIPAGGADQTYDNGT